MTAVRPVQCVDLGLIDYEAAFLVQEHLYQRCRLEEGDNFLLLQENLPVITIGRSGTEDHLLVSRERLQQLGIRLLQVSRGGDITCHGPGQLIASPILHLREFAPTAHAYVAQLEEVVIRLLARYGLDGSRRDGTSGVWVDRQKVAAIGIAVRHGITQHGVSVYVDQDTETFKLIIPCGMKDMEIASLKDLGVGVGIEQVKKDFCREFSELFGIRLAAGDLAAMG